MAVEQNDVYAMLDRLLEGRRPEAVGGASSRSSGRRVSDGFRASTRRGSRSIDDARGPGPSEGTLQGRGVAEPDLDGHRRGAGGRGGVAAPPAGGGRDGARGLR